MRRFLRGLRFSVLVLLLLVAGYAIRQVATNNFQTVLPGELYRSGSPEAADIAAYKERYDIRSIINLRGDNSGTPWYDAEQAEAKAQGVALLNFRMSAKQELTRAEVDSLVRLMRDAPKPLLVHCYSGSDRSGLAAALYLAAVKDQDVAIAKRQLWPIYGHSVWFFPRSIAMDHTFEAMEPYIHELGS